MEGQIHTAGFNAFWTSSDPKSGASVPYAEEISIFIEEALARGEGKCDITINSKPFTVDFKAKRQYNKQNASRAVKRCYYESGARFEAYPEGLPKAIHEGMQALLVQRISSLVVTGALTHDHLAMWLRASCEQGDWYTLRTNVMVAVNTELCAKVLQCQELHFDAGSYCSEDRHGGYGSYLEFRPAEEPDCGSELSFLLTDGGVVVHPFQGCEYAFEAAEAGWRAPAVDGWKFDTQTHAALHGIECTWDTLRRMMGITEVSEETPASWAMSVVAAVAWRGVCAGGVELRLYPCSFMDSYGGDDRWADEMTEVDKVRVEAHATSLPNPEKEVPIWRILQYADRCFVVGPGQAWCAGCTDQVWSMTDTTPEECATGLLNEPTHVAVASGRPAARPRLRQVEGRRPGVGRDAGMVAGWLLTGESGGCGAIPLDPWQAFGLERDDFQAPCSDDDDDEDAAPS